MNSKAVAATAAFLSTFALSGAAFAQATPAPMMMRGEHASDHNIRTAHRRVERIVDQLQRDQHDYGGHRVKAIQLLQQAAEELKDAAQYDKAHGT